MKRRKIITLQTRKRNGVKNPDNQTSDNHRSDDVLHKLHKKG